MQTKKTKKHTRFSCPLLILIIILSAAAPGCITSSGKPSDMELLKQEVTDYKSQVSRLNSDMEEMKLIIETHEQTIKDLENQKGSLGQINQQPKQEVSTVKPKPAIKKRTVRITNSKALYDMAYHTFSQKKLSRAEEQFKDFLEKYPHSDLSDNAMYWLGEIRYFQKDFKKAITLFEGLTEKYPEGNKCPDALLKIGYAYLNLKNSEKAKQYLTQVLKRYPFSSAGTKAEMLLERIN